MDGSPPILTSSPTNSFLTASPAASPAPKALKRKGEPEKENRCFLCLDDIGHLIHCTRRDCPKSYHAACTGREEAYFSKSGKWRCGWHFCNSCLKDAQFLCYTCTYSLCRGCKRNVEFLCVRDNKGFCETCFITIHNIESEHRNGEIFKVDFEDKNRFHNLFKAYWTELKAKVAFELKSNEESIGEPNDGVNDLGFIFNNFSKSSITDVYSKRLSRNTLVMGLSSEDIYALPVDTNWASHELLDFVAHMRDGDMSFLSYYDIRELLLEYTKQNNLQDPQKDRRIICDQRLRRLFVRRRIGYTEMLKRLESHYYYKNVSLAGSYGNQGGLFSNARSSNNPEEHIHSAGMGSIRNTHKKAKRKEPTKVNNSDNKLVYLRRRNLVEFLFKDDGKFDEKVLGSFVRIRVIIDQKDEHYRLVQVIGTCKAPEQYKVGNKTTNVLLNILNSGKKDTIPIHAISDKQFTEWLESKELQVSNLYSSEAGCTVD